MGVDGCGSSGRPQRARGDWQSIMAAGKPAAAEVRLRRFDGEYSWFLFRASPLRDASGTSSNGTASDTDIEDRKRAETHLAGEKQLLEMIASGRPLRDVLGAFCRLFEDAAPRLLLRRVPDRLERPRSSNTALAPSLPASYSDPIEGLAVSCDCCPAG